MPLMLKPDLSVGKNHESAIIASQTKSISKDVLKDKGCSWLIKCTTQGNLGNKGQDTLFNNI
jgi:hypothetical protein